MDWYLVFNIVVGIQSKKTADVFDLIECVSEELYESGGGGAVTWFVPTGRAKELFGQGVGVYSIRVVADRNRTRPTAAEFIGPVAWPSRKPVEVKAVK